MGDAILFYAFHDPLRVEPRQDHVRRTHGHEHHGQAAGGMGHGREHQVHGMIGEQQVIGDGRHHLPVQLGHGHTLGQPRGAAGTQHHLYVVAVAQDLLRLFRQARYPCFQIGMIRHPGIQAHGPAHPRALRQHFHDLLAEFDAVEQHIGIRVVEDMDRVGDAVTGVDGGPDTAGAQEPEYAFEGDGGVAAVHRDPGAGKNAVAGAGIGDAVGACLHLPVGVCPGVVYQAGTIRIDGDTFVEKVDYAH